MSTIQAYAGAAQSSALHPPGSVPFNAAKKILHPSLFATAKSLSDPANDRVADSRLTEIGAAGEIAFVWPECGIRLTIDPAPHMSPSERLIRCEAAMADSLASDQRTLLRQLKESFDDASMGYGAWLGLRLRESECAKKLYVELPQVPLWHEWETRWAESDAILSKRNARPVMVGLDPYRPGVEIYQRLDSLPRRGLSLLLRRFGFSSREQEIIDLLQALAGRPVRRDLPSDDLGFSVAFSAPGVATVLTLYSVSDALLGPESQARETLLTLGHKRSWRMNDYKTLTTSENGDIPHHGLVGIIVAHDKPLAVTVTLAVDLSWGNDE